jgi:hypothetical protein
MDKYREQGIVAVRLVVIFVNKFQVVGIHVIGFGQNWCIFNIELLSRNIDQRTWTLSRDIGGTLAPLPRKERHCLSIEAHLL